MKLNQNLLKNRNAINIIIILIVFFILIVFPKASQVTNEIIESTFYSIKGEQQVDSNIVIIKITDKDISALGGWPLKRSYYALLIDKLNELDVRKMGLEVYLSKNNSNQKIYNSLIINEIKEKNNIVFSALVNNLQFQPVGYSASRLLLPEIKEEFNETKVGHINFIENNGIVIPKSISIENSEIFSFAQTIIDDTTRGKIKVNFHSAFNKFKSYSILEFFAAFENRASIKDEFKNKIVLIGVTEPTIGKSISTPFNKMLAGIGLHAFAIDNFLLSRGLNDNYYFISQLVIIVLIMLFVFLFRNKQLYFYSFFLLLFLLSYVLFIHFYIELNYTAFVFPMVLLLFVEAVYVFVKRNEERDAAYSENEMLQKALFAKESKLILLENELKETSKPPTELLNKIEQLKDEIHQIEVTNKLNETPHNLDSNFEKNNFLGIIYASKAIENIVKVIKKVAPTDATVLIIGDSGSGKELVANAIHKLSNRKEKVLIAFNCAAIPENLLESELFGHVKGAFTDASKDKIGRFEAANNGTIFLDEIGETSEKFQAKLLRVLQSGEFQKVGSNETQKVDVRIIAATNKNLIEQVKQNNFREDLYYRLNVITIEVPNLDKRKEDIPFLADYFAKQESEMLEISSAVMEVLQEQNWKGNVRELESTIKRAAIFAKSESRNIIQLCDVPENIAKCGRMDLKSLILNSLREKGFSHSSISETAKELGNISRTIVSENYRGIFFEEYVKANYNFDEAVTAIANNKQKEVIEKITKKGRIYLINIEKDLAKTERSSFEVVKQKFVSKYKNLPQKYHIYLDDIIKNLINTSNI